MTPWSDYHTEIKVNGTPWCHILHRDTHTIHFYSVYIYTIYVARYYYYRIQTPARAQLSVAT